MNCRDEQWDSVILFYFIKIKVTKTNQQNKTEGAQLCTLCSCRPPTHTYAMETVLHPKVTMLILLVQNHFNPLECATVFSLG